MDNRGKIIEIFRKHVKGRSPNVSQMNQKHDGKYGHWLEEQFSISANALNEADILGYELKNQTTSKTTFGDWSANYYIFNDKQYDDIFDSTSKLERRNKFLEIFGKRNIEKPGRYSWSGEPCPKISKFNTFGQKLEIDYSNKDIVARYSFSEDQREDKSIIVPKALQQDSVVLARWYGNRVPDDVPFREREKCLKEKVENKFNQLGWFTCKMDDEGLYREICFGDPLNFDSWIDLVEKGIVYFDSGMYRENPRPYSQWRADNRLWDSLIVYRTE